MYGFQLFYGHYRLYRTSGNLLWFPIRILTFCYSKKESISLSYKSPCFRVTHKLRVLSSGICGIFIISWVLAFECSDECPFADVIDNRTESHDIPEDGH